MVKNGRPGAYSAFTCVLICVLLIMANGLAVFLGEAFSLEADLSLGALYTISEDTEALLAGITKDISIYTLYSESNEDHAVTALLSSFEAASPHITHTNIDPEENPSFIGQFSGASEGSVVVTNGDGSVYKVISGSEMYTYSAKYEKVAFKAESRIAAAIDYAATGISMRARFLTGHGETEPSSLSGFTGILDGLNFQVSAYDILRSEDPLNPKTDILICVSPSADLQPNELVALVKFFNEGGKAIFFMDPIKYDQTGAASPTGNLKNFSVITAMFGVSMSNRLVIGSENSSTSLLATSLILERGDHGMFDSVPEADKIVISEAGSLMFTTEPSVTVETLLETDDSCFSRAVARALTSLKPDGSDALSSFPVAVLSTRGEARAVIFSSSSIVNNVGIGISGNPAFMTSLLEFMGEENTRIKIVAKDLSAEPMYMSSRKANALAAGVIAIMPITVLLFGLAMLRRRRNM